MWTHGEIAVARVLTKQSRQRKRRCGPLLKQRRRAGHYPRKECTRLPVSEPRTLTGVKRDGLQLERARESGCPAPCLCGTAQLNPPSRCERNGARPAAACAVPAITGRELGPCSSSRSATAQSYRRLSPRGGYPSGDKADKTQNAAGNRP